MTIKEGLSVKEEGVEVPVSQVTQTSELQSCKPEVDTSPSRPGPGYTEVEKDQKETTSSVGQRAELLKSNHDVWPVTNQLGENLLFVTFLWIIHP